MMNNSNNEVTQRIFDKITEFLPEMIEVRRDFHAHPELAYEEHRTSAIIADLLRKWGYEVTTGLGKTGVVGQLRLGKGDKSIGIRADFDALPLQELTNLPYRSTIDGKMHACGHDGHTAMLLTAARYFAETKNFNGTLNLIFQPAEEGYAGAKSMIEDGLFKKFPCDNIYGIHNFPGLEIGSIASRKGSFMPSSDTVYITINGKGGHGAAPNLAVDPIVVGSSIVMALQTIISRNINPLHTAVVTVGSFRSGFTSNIIPEQAELILTVRSFDNDVRDQLQERIEAIVHAQAKSYGASAEIDYRRLYPVVINSEQETDYALDVAEDLFTPNKVNRNAERIPGSEDFAYMLEKLPGCYLMLGNGDSAPLHNPHYDFNDEVIPYGAAYWAHLVEKYLV